MELYRVYNSTTNETLFKGDIDDCVSFIINNISRFEFEGIHEFIFMESIS